MPTNTTSNTQVAGTTVHANAPLAASAEINQQSVQIEAQNTATGATPRARRAAMLDTTQFDKAHPQYHHRFVNIKNTDKTADRLFNGYVQVPIHDPAKPNPDHYGRRLGDELVLMRIPRAKYAELRAEIDERTRQRERAHVEDMSQTVNQVMEALARRNITTNRSLLLTD